MVYSTRDEIENKYKWKLEDIIESDDSWQSIYEKTLKKSEDILKYEGKLNNDESLFSFLELDTSLSQDLSKLYVYAAMRRDENSANPKYQNMKDKAEMLMVKIESLSSFATPEISELSKDVLEKYKASEKFKNYSVLFENIIRNKDIILSKAEEKIISEVSAISGTNDEVFTMFDNADIKFKKVRGEDGKLVEMSHGMYSVLLQSPSQKVRKDAFNSMFNAYKDHINTLAANYSGNVKSDWFYAKIRKFKSTLDYSMYGEHVDSICYKNLLKFVGEGTKPLHEYMALRKNVLGLEKLNMYDLFVPIVPNQEMSLKYEDAVKLVKDALSIMGDEYSSILSSAFNSGWVDVFESKGKKSGAYSWGTYGVHPYVLLNYQETIHDIFTIAHELGHAMHSYYSNLNQPYQKSHYVIFVAEIASTVNEVLLLKYLLKTATGDLRKYLLTYYLDMFRTTLFRQTMFSEFEEYAHKMIEGDNPINADNLSSFYMKLNKKYYGPSVTHNDLIKYEWARIPHFYSSYYVYKYATGITAAVSIATNLLEQGPKYFEKYKKFLSSGGSLPPLEILKLADVDLTKEEPFKKAMKDFSDTLEELKKSFNE